MVVWERNYNARVFLSGFKTVTRFFPSNTECHNVVGVFNCEQRLILLGLALGVPAWVHMDNVKVILTINS